MGYIKAQLEISQKRIRDQIKTAEQGLLPKRASEIIIPQFQKNELFKEREERLENIRQLLLEKQAELEAQQDLIRRRYNDFYLQQSIIKSGYSRVRRMNQELEEKYKALKKSGSVTSFKTLDQLGMIPRSGPRRGFYKAMCILQSSQQKAKRESILQSINASKEEKIRLIDQLKLLDWQRSVFHKDIKKLKEEKAKIRKDFYQIRYRYDRDLQWHNFNIFMRTVKDNNLKDQYHQTSKILRLKRSNQEVCSKELELLKKLDLEASRLSKINSPNVSKEEPLKKSIDDYILKPRENKPNRGISY